MKVTTVSVSEASVAISPLLYTVCAVVPETTGVVNGMFPFKMKTKILVHTLHLL